MYRINISEVTGGQTQEMARFARLPHFLFDQIYIYLSGKIANVRNVEFESQVSKNVYRCNFLLRRVYWVKV